MTRLAAVLASVLLTVLTVAYGVPAAPVQRAASASAATTAPPTVTGTARVGEVLRAVAADGDPASYAWRWLRDGVPVAGATAPTYRLTADDLGARLSAEATGPSADGSTAVATSEPTGPVQRGQLRATRAPSVAGEPQWGSTLTARRGAWSPWPDTLRLQWLRDGRPVPGATGRRHVVRPQDVGHRLALRVTARKAGYAARVATSRPVAVRHAVPVRRTVTYRVETRGRVTADVATFARLAQQTFDDPRGWRAGGTAFRRVRRGGDFSLVLATPEQLPRFSSVCSVEWSCRVGRYVVVNQTRWQRASPAWNRAGGSLRDYRHMVVNHETGHWLGRGHRGCPGPGRPAPVMMQQSKGLDGCRFNPWPTAAER